jgi:hypothetical protein
MQVRIFVLAGLCVSGCRFVVGAQGEREGSSPDLQAPFDGSAGPSADMAKASPDDLALADLANTPPPPPDMAIVFAPSHVDPIYYRTDAMDLSGVTKLDTDALTITVGAGTPATSPFFVHDSHGYAVLSAKSWTVDVDCSVVGTHALVVVASGAVALAKVIHAEAKHDVAGAGALTMGVGKGGAGTVDTGTSTGGGGGGAAFGTVGGKGADGSVTAPGGAAGATYGPLVSDLFGGAPGGSAAQNGACALANAGKGGGGGGVVQISSSVSISGAGGVSVAGGGGLGGCPKSGGGGGGAGGEIFFEAPAINVTGTFAANGGSGASGGGTGTSLGGNGNDGNFSSTPAGAGSCGCSGGAGGVGAAAGAAAGPGGASAQAGGGGGGVGRIWLRSRGAATTTGAVLSPAATLDTTLP